MDFENFSLIFYDNPISRAYLHILKKNRISNINIIYLGSSKINFLKRRLTFFKNLEFPLRYIKNDKISKLITEIQNYFNFEKNFIQEMYKYENLSYFKNIEFINEKSINSNSFIEYLNKKKNRNYLISHSEILKEVLKTRNNFYHIHPGYLPEIKGADSSLHSIKFDNIVGCSFFKLNENIDDGKIIYRFKIQFNKFNLENNFFSTNELYKIWYSFFDPLLRAKMLENIINNRIYFEKNIEHNNNGNYYSFMDENEKKEIFKKIFY